MATFVNALQARDQELAQLAKEDRILAAKEAEIRAAELKAEAAEADFALKQEHISYDLAKSMRPLPKMMTPTTTPEVEAFADDDVAEVVEQGVTAMGTKCTKNAASRTEKQVSHQRWVAARGKEQRAWDAERKARHLRRLESRNKRADYGIGEELSEDVSDESPKTGGKLELEEPERKNVGCCLRQEAVRRPFQAKRSAALRVREAAKRATRRRRLQLEDKRHRFHSSDESEEEPAAEPPVEQATQPAQEEPRRSGIGETLKSWFGGLFHPRRNSEPEVAPPAATTETVEAGEDGVAAVLVAPSLPPVRRPLSRRTAECRVRKALKQAAFSRRLYARDLRRRAEGIEQPKSPTKKGTRVQQKKVKVELELAADDVKQLIKELFVVPAVGKPVTSEEPEHEFDLAEDVEDQAEVKRPSHGVKNASAVTEKQLSCRRWEAAHAKELREREHNRKARDARREEARDLKFAAAVVEP